MGANLAIKSSEESYTFLYEDDVALDALLSRKNWMSPIPPDPSVCVIPIHNVYKSDST